jgi:hypothetical protein
MARSYNKEKALEIDVDVTLLSTPHISMTNDGN